MDDEKQASAVFSHGTNSSKSKAFSVYNFVDEHLHHIRWFSYGLGGIALILIFRSVRVTQKFTHSSQIPVKFIENATLLQGKVRNVTEEGTLHIEHIPILEFRMMSKIVKRIMEKDHHEYLNVKAAGVDMSNEGVKWLQKTTVGKHAWFQMFHRDSNAIYCDIKVKQGFFFRSSICTALIKQGLCKIEHFDHLPNEKAFNKYLRDLIAAEQKASSKNKGLWKEEKKRFIYLNGFTQKIPSVWNKMRNFIKLKFGNRKR